MLVPLRWLSDYVCLPADPADLADRLTVAGLEATAATAFGSAAPANMRVKTFAPLAWDADKIVVAKVLGIEKHPNADKLKLVTVDYGAGSPKTVVTGAPNIAPGQSGMKVVLGLNGSRYLTTDKEGRKAVATLEPKDLRGIPNDAMCMSEFELGLSDDHDGIILLDDSDPPPGTPAADVLGDLVVEVDVLPNMARCLGLVGLAREVAALTGESVTPPAADFPVSADPVDGKVAVRIADPLLCRRYTATLVRNVTVGPAPRPARSRLRLAGVRPISNVVDVTNYVMLETGQPLHAFDYDALVARAGGQPPQITVRPAAAGETLKTLDGQVRELTPDVLVIADVVGPIALAGVMGGADTEVTAATKNVLLEAAHFDPVSVRQTARRFNLFSEASGRFSRGVPPAGVPAAARRAAERLHTWAGGDVLAGVVDEYPSPMATQTVELTRAEIRRVLGVELPDAEVERVLRALDFQVEDTMWGWSVTVPPSRLDVQAGPADLIEELARVSGYDRLPETRLAVELPPQSGNVDLELEERTRDALAAAGLQECVTYSLSSPDAEAKLSPGGSPAGAEFVTLVNPVSPERAVLRRSLLPGLLAVAADNLGHSGELAAFEVGPVYLPRPGERLPAEPRRVAVVLAGLRVPDAWDAGPNPPAVGYDFFDLKGVVEGFLADLHVPAATYEPARDVPHLHPGRAARLVVGGAAVGAFGELHPRVAEAFDLAGRPAVVGEFDLDAILSAVPDRWAYRPISAFPPVLRDLAVVVPDATPAAAVLAEVRAAAPDLIEDARLFDVYRGDSVATGHKSLAYAITYRVADRQLGDKEVDKAHQQVEARLRKAFGAQVRGKDIS